MAAKYYDGIPIDFNDRSKWIGIIGSRKPTEQELHTAYEFGKRCAEKGLIVVSGLAEGIDTAGHMGCLDAGGTTIAVVSTTSFQAIYPKDNESLAERIKRQGGIIYPYLEKAPFAGKERGMSIFSRRFIERDVFVAYILNRIVVVKEADAPITGGTRWAAKYGMDFGKEVFRLGIDGTMHSNPEIFDKDKTKLWWDIELNNQELLDNLITKGA